MNTADLLVVNPKGGGPWRRVVKRARREVPGLTIVIPESRDELRDELTRAAEKGLSRILILGGDGTFSETVNVVYRLQLPLSLGFLAGGRGADFIRSLHIHRRAGTQSPLFTCDCFRVESDLGARYGLNVVSTGLSGAVVERIQSKVPHLPASLLYIVTAIRCSLKFKACELNLRIDGEKYTHERSLVVAIANGRFFGGGMPIAPEANISDGILEVVTLPWRPYPAILKLAVDLYRARHPGRNDVNVRKGKRISVVTCEGAHLEIDGDPYGTLPAHIEVIPGAISTWNPSW